MDEIERMKFEARIEADAWDWENLYGEENPVEQSMSMFNFVTKQYESVSDINNYPDERVRQWLPQDNSAHVALYDLLREEKGYTKTQAIIQALGGDPFPNNDKEGEQS